ncbi:hypothetical protein [Microcoleus sp. CAWBG58]|nr:hypothetical protein [Microcoleus sp. CAWBG58]
MNSLILISPSNGSGFQPILSGKYSGSQKDEVRCWASALLFSAVI